MYVIKFWLRLSSKYRSKNVVLEYHNISTDDCNWNWYWF